MAGREVGAELLGRNAEEPLQRADIAMYTVKETHAGFVLFDPTQDQHSPTDSPCWANCAAPSSVPARCHGRR
jgi:hypothetical protein